MRLFIRSYTQVQMLQHPAKVPGSWSITANSSGFEPRLGPQSSSDPVYRRNNGARVSTAALRRAHLRSQPNTRVIALQRARGVAGGGMQTQAAHEPARARERVPLLDFGGVITREVS